MAGKREGRNGVDGTKAGEEAAMFDIEEELKKLPAQPGYILCMISGMRSYM